MELVKDAEINTEDVPVIAQPPPAGGPAPSAGWLRGFLSLRHHNYQLWFGGMFISMIGMWMQGIALGWLVYEISHSEFTLGLVSFCSSIPVLLVSPWGGVITDRMPRRTLLTLTAGSAMALALTLSAITFSNRVEVWVIMIVATLGGLVTAFDAPARQAFVVDLVGREDMVNAIALNSMMFNGARVVGPALGGFLLAWLGSAWCFLINGIGYTAVITCLRLMQAPAHRAAGNTEPPLEQFRAGIAYVSKQREILGLLLLASVFSVFGMAYSALMPAFVDLRLHADASAYGVLSASVGVGAVLGALYVAYSAGYRQRGREIIISNLAYPLVLALFAVNTLFPLALLLAAVLGFGFMVQLNNMNSLIQLQVSDAMRGRVMGLYTLSFMGVMPFGSLLAGWAAESLGLALTIFLTAVVMLALSLLIHWRLPEIRRM